jgi:hypothetical protein
MFLAGAGRTGSLATATASRRKRGTPIRRIMGYISGVRSGQRIASYSEGVKASAGKPS